MDNFTICTKCEFFHNEESGSVREHIWYNHFCKASPAPTCRNPYDGKIKPIDGNKYLHCREINIDGNCPLYKPKQNKPNFSTKLLVDNNNSLRIEIVK